MDPVDDEDDDIFSSTIDVSVLQLCIVYYRFKKGRCLRYTGKGRTDKRDFGSEIFTRNGPKRKNGRGAAILLWGLRSVRPRVNDRNLNVFAI